MSPPRKSPTPKGPSAASGPKRPAGAPARPGKPAAPARPAAPKVNLPRVGKVKTGDYKANVATRAGAGAIDVLIAMLPAIGLYPAIGGMAGAIVSALVAAGYLLVRDGLGIAGLEHQSVGKKILGLHVEIEATGESKVDPLTSVKRNLPLAAGLVLAPFLSPLGVVPALAVAAVPGIVELVMAARDPNGIRLGDRIAGTKVLD